MLASLAIREPQIKMTLIFYLMIVRIANITKPSNNNCWPGYGQKRNPGKLLVEM
jgi:hypothetical protein